MKLYYFKLFLNEQKYFLILLVLNFEKDVELYFQLIAFDFSIYHIS